MDQPTERGSGPGRGGPSGSCPRWCTGDHGEGHDHDRKHMSAAVVLPVVQLVRGEPGRDLPRASEVAVVVHRRERSEQTWLYVGDGTDQQLELTPESWRRLVARLGEVLGEV